MKKTYETQIVLAQTKSIKEDIKMINAYVGFSSSS